MYEEYRITITTLSTELYALADRYQEFQVVSCARIRPPFANRSAATSPPRPPYTHSHPHTELPLENALQSSLNPVLDPPLLKLLPTLLPDRGKSTPLLKIVVLRRPCLHKWPAWLDHIKIWHVDT